MGGGYMGRAERKIPINVCFTSRQNTAIEKEAKRLQITFADTLRRIVDEWADKKPSLANKMYETAR